MIKEHLLGYQIVDRDNGNPEEFTDYEVLSITLADFWVRNFSKRKDWVLKPIYVGDIEKPRLIDLEDPPMYESMPHELSDANV